MGTVHRSAAGLSSGRAGVTTLEPMTTPAPTTGPSHAGAPSEPTPTILGASTRIPVDPALLSLARTQHGMLTTAQAAGSACPPRCWWPSSRRACSGTRAVACTPWRPSSSPTLSAWHRQLCAGALLLYPDAVLAGASAVLAHGIPVWGAPLGTPSILRPVSRAGGMSAFWVRPTRGDVVSTAWGPASDPATALVQHAVDHGIVTGVVSADAALREGIVTLERLTAQLSAVATWPHSSRAASMLRLVDGRRESVGESRCGVMLAMAGIAATPQVTITDARGSFVARVDFLVDGSMVVVEFDGKVKYAAGDPEVLWHEKRREDRLRALGYVVVRVTWAQLERPGAVAAAVRSAIAAR